MNGLFDGPRGAQIRVAIMTALWLLVAFLAVEVVSVLSGIRYIGAGVPAANTITVSGHGEVDATPNIATFTFTVSATKATVADAQAAATALANATTAYLKQAGVADADIKTSGYNVSPQYEYQNAACPQVAPANGTPIYCPPGKQVLTGYQVAQTTTVKVRDLSKAGDLLTGVGSKGATDVSGLQFTFDDPTGVQTQARTKAIADAKSKADELAKELGVTLVRVTSFNENQNGGGPVPMYAMASGAVGKGAGAPEINPGQNTVSGDVTVTYEIK